MKGYEFGQAIGRMGLLRAVCMLLAGIAGWLLRPRVLGALVGLIAAGVWMNGGVSLPKIHWPEWPQFAASPSPPSSLGLKEVRALWEVAAYKREWKEGYSSVQLEKVPTDSGSYKDYWVIFQGTSKTESKSEYSYTSYSPPITVLCTHVYGEEAQHGDVPRPYVLGFLRWPEITPAVCNKAHDSNGKPYPTFDFGPPTGKRV